MYAVVRRYANGAALADALVADRQEVEELLRGVPGFQHYYAVRSGDVVATITVCDDEAGTTESSRVARDWVQRNMPRGAVGTPEITEGETFLDFGR